MAKWLPPRRADEAELLAAHLRWRALAPSSVASREERNSYRDSYWAWCLDQGVTPVEMLLLERRARLG